MADTENNKNSNSPALRFHGFTDPWKPVTLGDVTFNFNRRNKECKEYPMYSVTNNRGFIPQNEQFEDREMVGEDIKSYKIIERGEFAYNPARINVGSIARYVGSEPCMISSLYVCFKPSNEVDGSFLLQFLKSPKANFYYNANGEGGVRIYLFYPNFARIRTAIPSLSEQCKISSFLKLLDERISTQRRLIDKLETLIKGIAELLTTNTPNTKITDCLVCHSSTLQENQAKSSGKYRVYGASGICGYTDLPDVTVDSILIVKDGSGVGTVAYASGKYSVIGTSNYLTAKNRNLLKYIYYCLKFFNFTPYKTGMAIPHIYFKDYGKAKIYCPAIEEQRKIAAALSNIERKIEIERTILQQYTIQKQYLLQQMFI